MRYRDWLLILSMAAVLAVPAHAVTRRTVPRIVVNNRVVQTDVPPRVVQGTTLVPIRFVAEALGADVHWDAARNEAVIVYQNQRIVAQVGRDELTAGNRVVATRVPTQVFQGRTMIPLRGVAESLGATVRWDSDTQTISIQTPEAVEGGTGEATASDVLRRSLQVSLRLPQQRFTVGAPVVLALRVKNVGIQPVTLQMATGQQFDFAVLRGKEEVWRWSHERAFTQVLTSLMLAPDESRTFSVTWNQRDNSGQQVAPGRYTVVGRVVHLGDTKLEATQRIDIAR